MDWGPIISAAIPSAVNLFGGLLGNSIEEDQYEKELQAKKESDIMALQLEALKARFAGGGGGGGGGGGVNPNMLTKAQKLAMMQNQGQARSEGLNSLIAAYQNAMGIR